MKVENAVQRALKAVVQGKSRAVGLEWRRLHQAERQLMLAAGRITAIRTRTGRPAKRKRRGQADAGPVTPKKD